MDTLLSSIIALKLEYVCVKCEIMKKSQIRRHTMVATVSSNQEIRLAKEIW